MKCIIVVIVCVFGPLVHAQNRLEKRIDATGISTISIKLDVTNQLTLKTTSEKYIELLTQSEGEYRNQTIVTVTQKEKEKLVITDALQPIFQNHQDKLSAHKVHAITTTITIPKKKHVHIEMASGAMYLMGDYSNLFVQSDAADVQINDFTGIAKIQSRTGTLQAAIENLHPKTATNTANSAHITTEDGNELFLNTVLGRVIIIE